MEIYGCVVFFIITLIFLYKREKIKLTAHFVVIVYLLAVAFGLSFEMAFGIHMKLFHYYQPSESPYWILLMGLIVYPAFHIVYLNLLLVPELHLSRWLIHTVLWIAFMISFEYVTILLKIVVFTGWDMWPWSIVTYIV
ncbi:MAG: hypothetical protein K6T85_14335, partial [Gorillibacterium sp.]|nr:hypothetical protein [Gorillibacterium sp.]